MAYVGSADAAVDEALAVSGAAAEDLPVQARLRDAVRVVVSGVDVLTTTIGEVRTAVEQHVGLDKGGLAPYENLFRKLAVEEMANLAKEGPEGDGDEEDLEGDGEEADDLATPPGKNSRKRRRHRHHNQHQKAAKRPTKRQRVGSHALPLDALPVTIAGVPVQLEPRHFQSGRKGYFACQGVPVKYDGKSYHVQFMVQCAIVELGDDDVQAAPAAEAEEVAAGDNDAPAEAEGDAVAEAAAPPDAAAPAVEAAVEEVVAAVEAEVVGRTDDIEAEAGGPEAEAVDAADEGVGDGDADEGPAAEGIQEAGHGGAAEAPANDAGGGAELPLEESAGPAPEGPETDDGFLDLVAATAAAAGGA